MLCAAANYLENSQPILVPHDVRHHPWVAIATLPDVRHLRLSTVNKEACNLPIRPKFSTNSGFAAKQLILLGAGIGLLPDYAIIDDLAQGRLVRILPEWRHRAGEISALYVHRKQMPPRVRLFLDFMKEDASSHLRSASPDL